MDNYEATAVVDALVSRIECGGMAECKRNCLVHSSEEVYGTHGMDNQLQGMMECLEGADCQLHYGIGQVEMCDCSCCHRPEDLVVYLCDRYSPYRKPEATNLIVIEFLRLEVLLVLHPIKTNIKHRGYIITLEK